MSKFHPVDSSVTVGVMPASSLAALVRRTVDEAEYDDDPAAETDLSPDDASTVVPADTVDNVSATSCPYPWCTDGNGHLQETERAYQWCQGQTRATVRSLEDGAPAAHVPPELDAPRISAYACGRYHQLPHVVLNLFRDFGRTDEDLKLTVAEAQELAKHLLATAAEIESQAKETLKVKVSGPSSPQSAHTVVHAAGPGADRPARFAIGAAAAFPAAPAPLWCEPGARPDTSPPDCDGRTVVIWERHFGEHVSLSAEQQRADDVVVDAVPRVYIAETPRDGWSGPQAQRIARELITAVTVVNNWLDEQDRNA